VVELPILKCIQQTTRSFTQVAAVYGKSNDGGASFNPIFDEHIQSIGCVAIDPSKPDQNIWVGTGETWTRNSVSMGDGIYKSTDGGQNWKNMGLPKSDRISSIIVDPKNSDIVWVGVLGALWR
jgi:photosystem II stability/assembly factor-like uncharacterized protein